MARDRNARPIMRGDEVEIEDHIRERYAYGEVIGFSAQNRVVVMLEDGITTVVWPEWCEVWNDDAERRERDRLPVY